MKTQRLFETIGLMCVAVTHMNCMSSNNDGGPATCKDAKDAYGVSVDGPQTLYIGGDKRMPWTASCVAMTTDHPQEFIELPQFDEAGKPANYSTFKEVPVSSKSAPNPGFTVTTRYERARIDPTNLTVDISNRTFVHVDVTGAAQPLSVALGNASVNYMPYGAAMECGADPAGADPAAAGTSSNINLRGLPFELGEAQLCAGIGGNYSVADSAQPTKIVDFHATGTSNGDASSASGGLTCGRSSVRCLPDPAINGLVGGQTAIQLRYVSATGGAGN